MDEKLPQKTEKPWGFELLLAHTPKYAGKLLLIKKGHRLSLQYHKVKDETLYVCAGKMLLEMEGSDGQMVQSEVSSDYCFRVPPMTKHRMQAIEETILFEVSTPELDDVVRVDDDYGRTDVADS